MPMRVKAESNNGVKKGAVPFRRFFLFLFLSASLISIHAQPFDYGKYSAVFYAATSIQGMVDYEWLKENPSQLNAFVHDIASLDKNRYESWSGNDKIAFYINVFNALCIKIIVDNYPIEGGLFKSLIYPKKSIMQISGAFNKIEFTVIGEAVTLEFIRDSILIGQFNEPRVHCTLSYGARGGPSLPGRPYEGEDLDVMFRFAAKEIVNDSSMFLVDRNKKKVYISELFLWHEDDFVPDFSTDTLFAHLEPAQGAVMNFFHSITIDPNKQFLKENTFKIEYIDFDWRLNDKKDMFYVP
ncbi:MAG: DUF547 domain-containing protein [Chitinivibrionales bacterium]|nr:DUF547 domain-containing protein [Chitinivibrionales bacterium]